MICLPANILDQLSLQALQEMHQACHNEAARYISEYNALLHRATMHTATPTMDQRLQLEHLQNQIKDCIEARKIVSAVIQRKGRMARQADHLQ